MGRQDGLRLLPLHVTGGQQDQRFVGDGLKIQCRGEPVRFGDHRAVQRTAIDLRHQLGRQVRNDAEVKQRIGFPHPL